MDSMQQAKTPAPRPTATATTLAGTEDVRKAVRENPVVVVSRKGCCMAHVAHRLLLGQGANPGVLEVGDDADAVALVLALNPKEDDRAKVEKGAAFPLVFIGGKVVVGLDKLMSMHIAGDLVPVLKLAGALWL